MVGIEHIAVDGQHFVRHHMVIEFLERRGATFLAEAMAQLLVVVELADAGGQSPR